MRARLQPYFLRFSSVGWGTGEFTPHLAYANLDFQRRAGSASFRQLLRWLGTVGPLGWTKERTIEYLKANQQEFRSCIDWLCRDADTDLARLRGEYDGFDDDDFDFNAREHLVSVPAVRFLQRHAFNHMTIELGHRGQDRSPFAGLILEHGAPKDPLDPICWFLIAILIRDTNIHIRRCRYKSCHDYFHPETAKKIFCSDSCRIRHHMKSTEDMRLYMRKRRALLKKLAARVDR